VLSFSSFFLLSHETTAGHGVINLVRRECRTRALDKQRFPGACEIRKFRFDLEERVVHVPARFSQSAATVIFFGRKFTSVASYRLPERARPSLIGNSKGPFAVSRSFSRTVSTTRLSLSSDISRDTHDTHKKRGHTHNTYTRTHTHTSSSSLVSVHKPAVFLSLCTRLVCHPRTRAERMSVYVRACDDTCTCLFLSR